MADTSTSTSPAGASRSTSAVTSSGAVGIVKQGTSPLYRPSAQNSRAQRLGGQLSDGRAGMQTPCDRWLQRV
eukprot:4125599-Prymnesium_polylepis.1